MDKQRLKDAAAKCIRKSELANAGAFLLVGVDRDAVGMGDGCALVWADKDSKWNLRFLNMTNRDAAAEDTIEVFADDDLCEDELGEDDPEQAEAADCRVWYSRHGASVCFYAHVNRTNDGLRIREDFVSMARGGGSREIPIAYWNTGRNPVKADGMRIRPGKCCVSRPSAPARAKRRELKREAEKCLAAQIEQYSKEQEQAMLEAVAAQIMERKPDWTEEQVRKAAEMFLEQEQSQSA